ncbi:hypothetical protein LOTGIDRAFT_166308 [Lottia gigantea]|uniref:WAP domain-containing protein n=1 Tax=Lottia gigantea TaxID=225164 RepID=V4A333_LOTGI|nr:hypothetical protein LOTGIDRAFT_166308 [Lottia gigantea]ESO87721.1 hypothetical protein LOTGIDRAFT_166308 [Lottia gigantea]
MQGFTFIICLVILIVEVTSSEFLKRLLNHTTTYPCNNIKCPGNKLCILEVKNKTCSGCTVSPLCISSDKLPVSECPIEFPIVNTKSDTIVPFRCYHDGDCPSGSFCYGKEMNGICCSGSYSIGRPFLQKMKHFIANINDHNLLNLMEIILQKSFQNKDSGKLGGSAVNLKLNLDKSLKQIDSYEKVENSTFQDKSPIDFRAGTHINRKKIVYFKHRNRRSPNGFYDSLHPSEQGLEVPLDKPGECSNVRLGKWSGGCMDTCFNDADCYSNLKCCFNGCARSCQFPIVNYNPDIPSKKPGRCPRLSSFGLSDCTGSSCTMDTDCPADDICCNSGDCGRICQHPIPNSPYW